MNQWIINGYRHTSNSVDIIWIITRLYFNYFQPIKFFLQIPAIFFFRFLFYAISKISFFIRSFWKDQFLNKREQNNWTFPRKRVYTWINAYVHDYQRIMWLHTVWFNTVRTSVFWKFIAQRLLFSFLHPTGASIEIKEHLFQRCLWFSISSSLISSIMYIGILASQALPVQKRAEEIKSRVHLFRTHFPTPLNNQMLEN